jgi:hypothetical protein
MRHRHEVSFADFIKYLDALASPRATLDLQLCWIAATTHSDRQPRNDKTCGLGCA